MPLTPKQKKDLIQRLTSFKESGILTAQAAYTKSKNIITSSERNISPIVCYNAVNLPTGKPRLTDKIIDILVNHDTHGFYNMALERHYFEECSTPQIFNAHVAARLYCSMVFIFDLRTVYKPSLVECSMELEKQGYVKEVMGTQNIEPSLILAILVPAGLKTFVKDVFSEMPIYEAPLQEQDFQLDDFTFATAICLNTGEAVAKKIKVPDYRHALKQFIKDHPQSLQFATHISRFQTEECMKHPFYLIPDTERAEFQQAAAGRLSYLISTKKDSDNKKTYSYSKKEMDKLCEAFLPFESKRKTDDLVAPKKNRTTYPAPLLIRDYASQTTGTGTILQSVVELLASKSAEKQKLLFKEQEKLGREVCHQRDELAKRFTSLFFLKKKDTHLVVPTPNIDLTQM